MAEKIPYQVFDRPLSSPPLTEAPQVLNGRIFNRRPNSNEAVTAYNSALGRLLIRGEGLEQRLQNGEFSPLGAISAKIEAGESPTDDEQRLMRDFSTLIDAKDARFGRRILNFANYVDRLNREEARGIVLTQQEEEIRVNYQFGNFHLIPGGDYRLDQSNTNVDRFVIPIKDNQSSAIIDGAPVEGIIRNIDREIEELKARTDISAWSKRCQLRDLRRERDVLFTASTPQYDDANKVTHARTEYEAYLKSIDPVLTEWEKPDWYKVELLLRERRILNLDRKGSSRWCLPLLIPIIAAIPVLYGQPEAKPVPVPAPIPAPHINVTDACFDVPGGKLRIELFDLVSDPTPAYDGHIQREMFYKKFGLNQRVYRPNNNQELIEGVDKLRTEEPVYYQTYLDTSRKDSTQAGQRVLGRDLGKLAPIVTGTDFSIDQGVLFSCTTPEQRDQLAKEASSR